MRVDVAIIFALEEEYSYYKPWISSGRPNEDPRTRRAYVVHDVDTPSGRYVCATTFAGDMGASDIALLTDYVLRTFEPRTVVLIGLAGSLDNEALIGDVVVADEVHDYFKDGKVTPAGFAHGGRSYRPHVQLVNAARYLQMTEPAVMVRFHRASMEDLATLVPKTVLDAAGDAVRQTAAKITPGPIASGPFVVADPPFKDWLRSLNRKFLAVEMESAGFMNAVYQHAAHERTLVIRAISDLADRRKTDLDDASRGVLRAVAMRNAIRLLHMLMETGKLDRHPATPEVSTAVEHYRVRKAGSFERWDMSTAGTPPTVGNRPMAIRLDDMYVPLRFDAKPDPLGFESGEPIAPDKLRGRRRQVLVGVAGSGKTTWMRWTFRRLIEDQRTDPRPVPFFLELRTIAASWTSPGGAGTPIDSYLASELTACGVSDASSVLSRLLAPESGFQPVLLIDGWDELGKQGDRVRRRLREFCLAFPHVVVIVSSRPYGDTRPAEVEDFETLYIQPLSDRDIRLLAGHFQRHVHGLDETAGTRATQAFMTALDAARYTRSLARTALLLTMILLVSHEGPLPDRRHKLYNQCLRNLLGRVIQREQDGAVVDPDQWRPDDSDEALRVVAELAYRMQSDGYENADRGPIIRSSSDAVGLLHHDEWTLDRRARFLRWLIASAGILVDRTDSSVHFAHLSFQEHLAAYHLCRTCYDREKRIEAVGTRIEKRDWWESLRLWAGLTGDFFGPTELSSVLRMLRADREGYWLAGEIFADGTGLSADFEAWAAELPARLSSPFGAVDDCAREWAVSKQVDRRTVLTSRLQAARTGLHWLEGMWHAYWCELAGLKGQPAPSLARYSAPISNAAAVARSRALSGVAASWPDGGELAILRLWPSARAVLGTRLQAAVSIGASKEDVIAALPALLARPRSDGVMMDVDSRHQLGEYFEQYLRLVFGENSVQNVDQYFRRHLLINFDPPDRDSALTFGHDFRRDFVRKAMRALARRVNWTFVLTHGWDIGRQFARDYAPDFIKQLVYVFGRDLAREASKELVRGVFHDLIRQVDRDFGQAGSLPATAWLPMFAMLEAGSVVGRAALRAVLAHGELLEKPAQRVRLATPVNGSPALMPEHKERSRGALLRLFRAACKASFAGSLEKVGDEVSRACAEFAGDPLWTALARHIARMSTAEDRALLEELARNPASSDNRIQWGLTYYVRGDIVFDADRDVTLDDLCAQAGVAPPPLLDDMPPELTTRLPFGK